MIDPDAVSFPFHGFPHLIARPSPYVITFVSMVLCNVYSRFSLVHQDQVLSPAFSPAMLC